MRVVDFLPASVARDVLQLTLGLSDARRAPLAYAFAYDEASGTVRFVPLVFPLPADPLPRGRPSSLAPSKPTGPSHSARMHLSSRLLRMRFVLSLNVLARRLTELSSRTGFSPTARPSRRARASSSSPLTRRRRCAASVSAVTTRRRWRPGQATETERAPCSRGRELSAVLPAVERLLCVARTLDRAWRGVRRP